MVTKKDFPIAENKGKHILADAIYDESKDGQPVVIFCHGYKGFKDWGAWELMGRELAAAGYFFLKFNFSHNGGTVQQPIDFPDLDAFAKNNYTLELTDLKKVIDAVTDRGDERFIRADRSDISLIGHSRAGGIVLINASEDERVGNVITLAGVSDYGSRFPQGEAFEEWRDRGVYYVKNGRTGQQMPHYFQWYKDFEKNRERLDIQRAARSLKKPLLIIHGDSDETVSVEEAKRLKTWNPQAILQIIEGADHTFQTSHPWNDVVLSENLKLATEEMKVFLREKTSI